MKSKKNIVFVSISSDMYGSSKVLLSLVMQMKKREAAYNPIVCMPYEPGPLKDILIKEGVLVIEMPVVKLNRSMLKSLKFFSLMREYFMAKKILKRQTKGMKIDIIQSNTLATLFGAFYCVFHRPKHIIHVHEIMDRPKVVSIFFKNVLRFLCDFVVYNSEATRDFYNGMAKSLTKKSTTIVNGVDRYETTISETEKEEIRDRLFEAKEAHFLIGLVGRINRLKGHHLLLEAFKEIASRYPGARLCYVGSPPPGQEEFLTNLRKEIAASGVQDRVAIIDFQDRIFSILESLDLIIVPSTEPESFGLIVVEAMLAKRAVIGADIGGISTIIKHEETGLLFRPNGTEELVAAITRIIDAPEEKKQMEERAFQNAMAVYSTDAMFDKFNQLYQEIA